MNPLIVSSSRGSTSLPSIFTAQPQAKKRMRDFFSSHVRNKNTRRAYLEAVRQFSAFCAVHGIEALAQVEPGDEREIAVRFRTASIGQSTPRLLVEGFNVFPDQFAIIRKDAPTHPALHVDGLAYEIHEGHAELNIRYSYQRATGTMDNLANGHRPKRKETA